MMRVLTIFFGFAFAGISMGRDWTDVSGRYRVEAALVAVSDESAVLKTTDNRLLMVQRAQLSEADRTYLSGTEATAEMRPYAEAEQTWTMVNGLRLIGRVTAYGIRNVTFQRVRGDIEIDGVKYDKIAPEYQKMVPAIVSYFENVEIKDEAAFKNWMRRQGGEPKTYRIEGVSMQLNSGLELRVPIFLFAARERALIEPGLAQYRARLKAEMDDQAHELAEQRESMMLQSMANAYHADRARSQQMQMMQLDLLAVNAGLTDLWEVTLYPTNGYGYPTAVVVSARNSLTAQNLALQKYPGYTVGPTRKVAGY